MASKTTLRAWVEAGDYDRIETYVQNQNPSNDELRTLYHTAIAQKYAVREGKALRGLIDRRIVPDELPLMLFERMASDGFADEAVKLVRMGATPDEPPRTSSYAATGFFRALVRSNCQELVRQALDNGAKLPSYDQNMLNIAAAGAQYGPQCLRLVAERVDQSDVDADEALQRYVRAIEDHERVSINEDVLDCLAKLGLFEGNFFGTVTNMMGQSKPCVESGIFQTYRALIAYGLDHAQPTQDQADTFYRKFAFADDYYPDQKTRLIDRLTNHGLYPSVRGFRQIPSGSLRQYVHGRLPRRKRQSLAHLQQKIAC